MVAVKKNVLIVEDSNWLSDAIKIILEKDKKIKVTQIFEGKDISKQVLEENIDLVILDLNLPVMRGEDIFKILKSNAKTKDLKIMILTARADALKWHEELSGSDKFIAKPFDNEELKNEVKKILKIK
jgi:two-component system, OmpR family, response regulator protein GraR